MTAELWKVTSQPSCRALIVAGKSSITSDVKFHSERARNDILTFDIRSKGSNRIKCTRPARHASVLLTAQRCSEERSCSESWKVF